jgi:hypothetical protein
VGTIWGSWRRDGEHLEAQERTLRIGDEVFVIGVVKSQQGYCDSAAVALGSGPEDALMVSGESRALRQWMMPEGLWVPRAARRARARASGARMQAIRTSQAKRIRG